VGLGCTIGNIDAATVKRWFDDNDSISISVKYLPPTKAELLAVTVYDWATLHDPNMLEIVPPLTSAGTPITNKGTNSLENAINQSSSCPPGKPVKAIADFDLFMKRMKTSFNAEPGVADKIPYSENLDIATGDGRLQLLVQKPAAVPFPQEILADGSVSTKPSSIINGANIYGIWEPEAAGSSYKKYFDDPALNPSSLRELSPWLVTRRYSCNAQLTPFFAATNPNLAALRAVPPRTPAFQSASKVISKDRIVHILKDNTVEHETMPRTKLAADEEPSVFFSLDVREGFLNPYNEALHQTWDKLPISNIPQTWDPALWRGNVIKTIPQAYRFWATSIDIFGQESDPIPVEIKETSSNAPGTLFHFKYRTALQPPPANDTGHPDRLQLAYKADKLMASWESPFKNTIGNTMPEGTLPYRMEKSKLICNVVILRKPHNTFTREIEDDKLDEYIDTMIFPLLDVTLRNDKWKIGFREILKHNSNWLVYKTEKELTSATAGDKWNYEKALTKTDLGFDYMILINFGIPGNQQQFWTGNDMARNMQLIQQERANAINKDFYSERQTKVQDTPTISNVAFTPSVVVANPMLPKQAKLLNFAMITSMPVLGVQGLNRDQLLSNILTTPDDVEEVDIDGVKENAVKFISGSAELEQGIQYTGTQQVMVNAALHRCQVPALYDITVSRSILFRELSNLNQKIYPEKKGWHLFTKDSNQNIVSNSLIGFRGLAVVKFRYESVYAAGETDQYAEGIKYVVHQARVQLSENIGASASLASLSFRTGTSNNFSDVIFDRAVALTLDQPAFMICKYAKGYTISQLIQFSNVGDKYSLQLATPLLSEGIVTGVPEKLFVVLSDQLHESGFEVNDKGYYDENILLPVGGGFRELFIWSFTTVSALGKSAASPLLQTRIFQSSLLPPMPTDMSARTINTVSEKEDYILNKTDVAHKIWIPKNLLVAAGDLKRFPRNYIRYAKDSSLPEDVYLSIERDFKSESSVTKMFADIRNAWELAAKIERLQMKETNELNEDGTPNPTYNPKGILFLKWLAETEPISLYRWLFTSAVIEVPGEMQTRVATTTAADRQLAGPLSTLFSINKKHLPANKALINDLHTTTPSVMFVDYFYHNDDINNEMDTFLSYNYRLQTYIDIDPNGDLGIKDPAQKYLYSRPTEWTDWIRPAFPEIEDLHVVSETPQPADILTPEVHFSFVLSHSRLQQKSLATPNKLYYRIIVKREVKNSLSSHSSGPQGSIFTEIGELRDLAVANSTLGVIISDNFLERENIGEILTKKYQIEVIVISKDMQDRIQLIRKPFLKQFTVSLDTPPASKELIKNIEIMIK